LLGRTDVSGERVRSSRLLFAVGELPPKLTPKDYDGPIFSWLGFALAKDSSSSVCG